MKHGSHKKGFSLIETVVVLVIFGILLTLATYWYQSAKTSAALKTASDGMLSSLEKAHADAVTGKNGTGAGVYVASTSYTFFNGDIYNASSSANTSYSVDSSLSISNTTSTILFSRLTGSISSTATVTISQISSPSNKKVIVIENSGDVNMVQ
jgi:prepilin-type N-terminal cleavage/methylation domain-containing protein